MSYAVDLENIKVDQLYRCKPTNALHRVKLLSRHVDGETILVSYQVAKAPAFVDPEIWTCPVADFEATHELIREVDKSDVEQTV